MIQEFPCDERWTPMVGDEIVDGLGTRAIMEVLDDGIMVDYHDGHESTYRIANTFRNAKRFTIRRHIPDPPPANPIAAECDAIKAMPSPTNGHGDMWREVIADMEARRRLGIERYGKPVQTGNGRDALLDAYHEALDLVVYLRQALDERK